MEIGDGDGGGPVDTHVAVQIELRVAGPLSRGGDPLIDVRPALRVPYTDRPRHPMGAGGVEPRGLWRWLPAQVLDYLVNSLTGSFSCVE